MIKYLTTAFCLLMGASLYAQGTRADTSTVLSVYNTGVCFKMEAADFGGVVTTTLVGTMVMSYDTTMVLKDSGKKDTISRRAILRHKVERQCDKMSRGLNGKIVVMELNKDCDVTQTCLNVQRAGAKAFVIIHNSNAQGTIKLPKRGLYKDSIRIPIFTVRSGVGDSITTLLPTVVGIRKPVSTVQALTQSPTDSTGIVQQSATKSPQSAATTTQQGTESDEAMKNAANNPFLTRIGWDIAPNPVSNEVTLNYNFKESNTIKIDIFNEIGQLVTNYQLPDTQTGKLDINVSMWQNGTYNVRLTSGKFVEMKRMIVVH
jgi:Secretion system C-terminal sorting domain/PA domain